MKGRYFFGSLLIIVGSGFLLDQLGYIDFGSAISLYWPSILIFLGVFGLFDKDESRLGNLILISFGILLQMRRLDYIDSNIFNLFIPIVLILVGFNLLIFRGIMGKNKVVTEDFKENFEGKNSKKRAAANSQEYIDATAIMSGIENKNNTDNFKGGRITAIMGGVEIDLRDAKLCEEGAFLELNAIMGGIDISLPDDWRVEVSGVPILGAWTNKSRGREMTEGPILKVHCFVLMGGIDLE